MLGLVGLAIETERSLGGVGQDALLELKVDSSSLGEVLLEAELARGELEILGRVPEVECEVPDYIERSVRGLSTNRFSMGP